MLGQLLPVLFLFVFVAAFGAALLGLTSLLGPKILPTTNKSNPYECGVDGEDPGTTKIPVKFYLTAISFILFDIEVIFLYPWALIFLENVQTMGGYLLIGMGLFVGILVYGLFYEWKARALEWD